MLEGSLIASQAPLAVLTSFSARLGSTTTTLTISRSHPKASLKTHNISDFIYLR